MVRKAKGIVSSILDMLYPRTARCMACADPGGTDGGWLCAECRKRLGTLRMAGRALCPRCGELLEWGAVCRRCEQWPENGVERARYCYGYAFPANNIVRKMKYDGVYEMTQWMGEEIAADILRGSMGPIDALVPVPMHPARRRERGLNHALCLAQSASRASGIPLMDVLVRTRNTKQQARQSGEVRRNAMIGAFAMQKNAPPVEGLRVALIDDVITTGATVNECASVLYASGAQFVCAAAFAGHSPSEMQNGHDSR